MKNIIHISDLHLSATPTRGFQYKSAAEIIDRLIFDVQGIENNRGVKFDTVFFTGDLAFSGSEKEY
ncbi:TPA: metallophosphoesterase, partial [Klebsiella michiganensis]|nr:metallophosphoesterase [Klebsiella michiganensis]